VPHDRCLEPHDEQVRIQLGSIEPMPIAEVPIIRYLEKCYGMYDIHLSEEVSDYFIEFPFFCLMSKTPSRSIESVFQRFVCLKGAAFFHLVHGFSEKIFNSLSSFYIVRTGIIAPRSGLWSCFY